MIIKVISPSLYLLMFAYMICFYGKGFSSFKQYLLYTWVIEAGLTMILAIRNEKSR